MKYDEDRKEILVNIPGVTQIYSIDNLIELIHSNDEIALAVYRSFEEKEFTPAKYDLMHVMKTLDDKIAELENKLKKCNCNKG